MSCWRTQQRSAGRGAAAADSVSSRLGCGEGTRGLFGASPRPENTSATCRPVSYSSEPLSSWRHTKWTCETMPHPSFLTGRRELAEGRHLPSGTELPRSEMLSAPRQLTRRRAAAILCAVCCCGTVLLTVLTGATSADLKAMQITLCANGACCLRNSPSHRRLNASVLRASRAPYDAGAQGDRLAATSSWGTLFLQVSPPSRQTGRSHSDCWEQSKGVEATGDFGPTSQKPASVPLSLPLLEA